MEKAKKSVGIMKLLLIFIFVLLLIVSLGLNVFMFKNNGWDIKPIVWIEDKKYHITQDFFEHRQNLKYDEGYQTGKSEGYNHSSNRKTSEERNA